MKSMICPMCGGICEFKYGKGFVCRYCFNIYSTSEVPDKEIEILNYANEKRCVDYDFESALQAYEEILQTNPNNQVANWGAMLAEYQIIYLPDSENKYRPTFLNPNCSTPITKSKYYNLLDMEYKKKADFIETVRQEVIRGNKEIPDYDVFISYKQHVENSSNIMTEEATWAAEIYRRLTKLGLHVFYDEESLKGGSSGWEPHIYSALKSSKYLVILGTSISNINSTWVKNEWKRFLFYRRTDVNKTFAVAGKNFNPEMLSYDLKGQQMHFADKENWMEELIEAIKTYFERYNSEYLLEEAESFIQKRKFKKAKKIYTKVCETSPRSFKAHWGLLMCKFKAMDDYDLVKRRKKIGKTLEYHNAMNYVDEKEKEYYQKVSSDNLTHNITGYKRENFKAWLKATKVKRFFKKMFIILFFIGLGFIGIFSGIHIYNKKSNEYSLILDYGEAEDRNISSIKIYMGDENPKLKLPNELQIIDKYYMDFVGWYTKPNCEGLKVADENGILEVSVDMIISQNKSKRQIKLYAGFIVHQYSVTFYDHDGHTILKSTTAPWGTELKTLGSENFFVGNKKIFSWSTTPNGEEYKGVVENDLSLYALSLAIKVEYSNDGSTYFSTYVKIGDTIPMPTPEKQYYRFVGWTYQNRFVAYGFTAPEENITLVAQWEKTHFSLTLNPENDSENTTTMIKAGDAIILPALTKEYYQFLGWEYNGLIINNNFTMPAENVILTAKWERTHFALTLNSEGDFEKTTTMIKAGSVVSLPNLTKEYYQFLGWEYKGTTYNNGFTMPAEDVILTATWKRTHFSLTLNSDGGSVNKTEMVKAEDTIPLPIPTRDYYQFLGWEYKGSFVNNSFTMPAENVILTARWQRTHYIIRFDNETKYVKIGESFTLPTNVKVGYLFKGWKKSGSNQLYNGLYQPTEDTSFTSSWEAKTFTITLNGNGGSVGSATTSVTYGNTFKIDVPTRSDYEFVGWYTTTNSSGIQKTNQTGASVGVWDVDAASITLYAIWTKSYKVGITRQSCKTDNGFNPAEPGTNSGSLSDQKAHSTFELLELYCKGYAIDSNDNIYVPSGTKLSFSVKVLQDINNLPTQSGYLSWTIHYLTDDSYRGSVYGTNINGQTIGYGAYYVKVTYADGSTNESNKVNFLKNAQKDRFIDLDYTISSWKKITKVEVVFVYEIFYDCTPWWEHITGYGNWRCSTTLSFN